MEDLARRAATTGRARPRMAREVPRRPGRDMTVAVEGPVVMLVLRGEEATAWRDTRSKLGHLG